MKALIIFILSAVVGCAAIGFLIYLGGELGAALFPRRPGIIIHTLATICT